jgi:hypothetical protein
MNKPLPDDFPDLDLEAWRAALPMPEIQVQERVMIGGKPGRSPCVDVVPSPSPADAIARKPAQPRSEPPPYTLSPIEKRGIRRRKEKP